MTIPNLVSLLRLGLTPLLLLFAVRGEPNAYAGLLAFLLFTDILDGWLARRLRQGSALGARLDSLADLPLYFLAPLGAILLWPDTAREQANWIVAIVLAYAIPILFALSRFGRLAAYHTWSAKLSGVLLGAAFFAWFAFSLLWPLHIAVVVRVLATIEEVAMTSLLAESRSNVPTIYHALRFRMRRVVRPLTDPSTRR